VTDNAKCLCEAYGKYTADQGGDCSDTDASVYPGAEESCNGKDDDCDDETDEKGAQGCEVYYFDNDGDTYGVSWSFQCLCEPQGKHTAGEAGDCNDADSLVNPDATEECNGVDDDCDGETDEAGSTACMDYFFDNDGDGFGVTGDVMCLCGASGKYTALVGEDCNDQDDTANPDQEESCNGKDDDCDGATDEEGAEECGTYLLDGDSDGWGIDGDTKCLCGPAGEYTAEEGGDCDDAIPEVNPGADELCANDIDDDCDDATDEAGCSGCITYYLDTDDDTWGVTNDTECLSEATGDYTATRGGDCDDDDGGIHPEADESCNGEDDDCDGATDEEGAIDCSVYFLDGDGDSFGVTGDTKCLCGPAGNYDATQGGDCDDGNAGTNPDSNESCNGSDDDCDSMTDEEGAAGCAWFLYDYDQDGYGVTDSKCLCSETGKYSAINGGDCNDTSNQVFPGATEVCNSIDDDCDNQTDEVNATGCQTFYRDSDNDGYGTTQSQCLCSATGDYDVTNDDDCCDSDANARPGQSDYFTTQNSCGSWDYNCNNSTDYKWGSYNGGCSDWGVGNGCNVESGWQGSMAGCGQTKNYVTGGCGYCCFLWTCCCDPGTSSRTQACR